MARSSEMSVPAGRPVTVWSLHDVAGRLRAYVWWERRLFELLGAAVLDLQDAAAKVLLAGHSLHAEWRAAQWEERLPVTHDLGGFAGPSPAAQTIVAEMLASPVSARVAGAYVAVLPALAAAYADHTPAASASADGPVARVLLRVGADLDADLVAGEALLSGAGAGGLPAAAQWRDRLAETGGISAAPEGASGGTTLR